MTAADLAIVAALVFAWGALSNRLEGLDMTAPLVFTTAGMLLVHGPLAPIGAAPDPEVVRVLAEGTLALLLFSDASRVGIHHLRADLGLTARLLGVGLPLTIAAGTLLALMLLAGDWWLALLVGAALASTDAALGAPLLADPDVPSRIRRLLNVESGLNDGIATPVVSVAIAGAASAEHLAGIGPGRALAELALGAAVGLGVGGLGGALLGLARRHEWVAEGFPGPTVLAIAVCAYAAAVAAEGNGFVAAFVAGLAFATAGGRRGTELVPFVEETGSLLSLLVWLTFGALAVWTLGGVTWRMVLYALLSLTVVRMVPVAAALAGSGFRPGAVAFVGWFGPRGLASVVFALLALEDLDGPGVDQAVTVITLTVLASVVAHGISAAPLARRYGARLAVPAGAPQNGAGGIPERRLVRRSPLGRRASVSRS